MYPKYPVTVARKTVARHPSFLPSLSLFSLNKKKELRKATVEHVLLTVAIPASSGFPLSLRIGLFPRYPPPLPTQISSAYGKEGKMRGAHLAEYVRLGAYPCRPQFLFFILSNRFGGSVAIAPGYAGTGRGTDFYILSLYRKTINVATLSSASVCRRVQPCVSVCLG